MPGLAASRRWQIALGSAVIVCLAFSGCSRKAEVVTEVATTAGGPPPGANTPTTTATPTPRTPTPTITPGLCTGTAAADLVRELVDALAGGDEAALQALLGEETWTIAVSRDLYGFLRREANPPAREWNTGDDLGEILDYFGPFAIEVTEIVGGEGAALRADPGGQPRPLSGMTVSWSADGPAVRDADVRGFSGGGQAATYCDTGGVRHLLLAPLTVIR